MEGAGQTRAFFCGNELDKMCRTTATNSSNIMYKELGMDEYYGQISQLIFLGLTSSHKNSS